MQVLIHESLLSLLNRRNVIRDYNLIVVIGIERRDGC